ncbi:UvrD-helicase domain-containing protein [Priestia filamentosa]|uniref:UvrD-helicase domain-containing protein n=1 Tax=Priestia filamentosa TaxID=1402861 RepID=UPI0039827726
MNIDNDEFRERIAKAPLTENIIVQAGPGSGKTSLLINRLKYIIENRTKSFAGIACITYTNAAKEEIIMRLQNEGVKLPIELFIGTIHSFLLENVVNPYSHFLNKSKETYKLAPFGFVNKHKSQIEKLLNRRIYDERTLKAFESLGYDEEGNAICHSNKIPSKAALEWKRFMLKNKYIDQQDVIYMSYFLLKKYPHICNALSSRFPHIVMDEYQDVTFYQEKIFSLLEYSTLFCVGDPNQSVYSFTGAKPEVFHEKWNNKDYKSYTLINNFRSTESIVKFANHKAKIIQVEAGQNASNKQKVLFIKGVDNISKVIQIFHHIRSDVEYEEGHKPYMILGRRNDYVRQLLHFSREQHEEVSTFLQKLKKEHPRCFQILKNLSLAISYKRRGEFDRAIEKMDEAFGYLFFNQHPQYVQLSEINYDKFMWKKMQIFTIHFLDNLILTETSVPDLFKQVKDFLSKSSKQLYNKSIGQKIVILNYNWKNQVKSSKATMLSELVEQLEIQETSLEKNNSILSIHSSKGQEAESVLVMAETEDQLLEWIKDNDDSEESRVGYVAFSRARKLLCIWAPSICEENYKHLESHISFIDETYIIKTESI